jgi:flagella basal body P-ring formation protein FlgA
MTRLHVPVFSLIAAVCALVCSAAPARAQHNSVTVHGVTKITGGRITLGDIATIAGDLRFIVQAESVVIGNAPYAGSERSLTRNQIAGRLRQHGLNPREIALDCPDTVRILSDYREYGEAELQRIFVDYILSEMPWRRDQVDIQNVQCRPVQIPNVAHRHRVVARSGGDFSGRSCAMIEFYDGTTLLGKTPVSAAIQVMAPVLVAQRTINRHDVLSDADLRYESRDITSLSRSVMVDSREIVGRRAKGRINQGGLLTPAMVEPAPVIKKGDIVTLYVESDALKITVPGEALQDGYLNEIISVSNLMSKKHIYGFVSGPSMVQARY